MAFLELLQLLWAFTDHLWIVYVRHGHIVPSKTRNGITVPIRAGVFSRCRTASKRWRRVVEAFGMLVLAGSPHMFVKKAVEPVAPMLGRSPRVAKYEAAHAEKLADAVRSSVLFP
jgi:hypothetical protein